MSLSESLKLGKCRKRKKVKSRKAKPAVSERQELQHIHIYGLKNGEIVFIVRLQMR